jgi:hypothetical protein
MEVVGMNKENRILTETNVLGHQLSPVHAVPVRHTRNRVRVSRVASTADWLQSVSQLLERTNVVIVFNNAITERGGLVATTTTITTAAYLEGPGFCS